MAEEKDLVLKLLIAYHCTVCQEIRQAWLCSNYELLTTKMGI